MKSREAFSGRSFGHVTRDPIVKRSGGKSPNQRVLFVRSTFDWAVCSEPLARLRRTRDSIANLGCRGNAKVGSWPKWTRAYVTAIERIQRASSSGLYRYVVLMITRRAVYPNISFRSPVSVVSVRTCTVRPEGSCDSTFGVKLGHAWTTVFVQLEGRVDA